MFCDCLTNQTFARVPIDAMDQIHDMERGGEICVREGATSVSEAQRTYTGIIITICKPADSVTNCFYPTTTSAL